MHWIFRVPELLSIIFRCLENDRRSLIKLMQCCQSFNTASATIIWRRLDSIIPLLRLFPGDAIKIKQPIPSPYYVEVPRLLSNADWTRFDIYAPYVRKLSYSVVLHGNFSPALEGSMLSRMKLGRDGDVVGGVLPNLTHLSWSIRNIEDVLAVCRLLSRKLVSLNLRISPEDIHINLPRLRDSITLISPFLSDLSITGPNFCTNRGNEHFASIIRAPKHLRILRVDIIDFISNHESLPIFHDLAILSLRMNADFPKAVQQTLTTEDCTSIANLIPAVSDVGGVACSYALSFWMNTLPIIGPNILKIQFTSQEPVQLSTVRDLVGVVGDSCPSLLLFRLSEITFSDPEAINLSGIFRPLLKCPFLRVLDVSGRRRPKYDFSQAVTDKDIAEMASAWRNLETLHLSVILRGSFSDAARLPRPTLTLDAVGILASRCPCLRSLMLTVNAEARPSSLNSHDTCGFSQSSLEVLDMCESTISNPFDVAVWLGDVCPADCIRHTGFAHEHAVLGERSKLWRQAKDCLRGMQNMRNAEREKAREIGRMLEVQITALKLEVATLKADQASSPTPRQS